MTSKSTYINGVIGKLIADKTGYGTLGHLVEVLINDRRVHNGDFGVAVEMIGAACERADELWDGIVGPMLDELERALK